MRSYWTLLAPAYGRRIGGGFVTLIMNVRFINYCSETTEDGDIMYETQRS